MYSSHTRGKHNKTTITATNLLVVLQERSKMNNIRTVNSKIVVCDHFIEELSNFRCCYCCVTAATILKFWKIDVRFWWGLSLSSHNSEFYLIVPKHVIRRVLDFQAYFPTLLSNTETSLSSGFRRMLCFLRAYLG